MKIYILTSVITLVLVLMLGYTNFFDLENIATTLFVFFIVLSVALVMHKGKKRKIKN